MELSATFHYERYLLPHWKRRYFMQFILAIIIKFIVSYNCICENEKNNSNISILLINSTSKFFQTGLKGKKFWELNKFYSHFFFLWYGKISIQPLNHDKKIYLLRLWYYLECHRILKYELIKYSAIRLKSNL